MKITFLGAGSTIFAKNVLGDVLLTPSLNQNLTIALYDINGDRLNDSFIVIDRLNKKYNDGKAKIDSTLCVGCGVCEQLCKFGALCENQEG